MKIASIPDPVTTVEGLYRTVEALKQAVEQMAGLRGPAHAATIYVSPVRPASAGVVEGDFWLCTSGTATSLSIFVGSLWKVVWP